MGWVARSVIVDIVVVVAGWYGGPGLDRAVRAENDAIASAVAVVWKEQPSETGRRVCL